MLAAGCRKAASSAPYCSFINDIVDNLGCTAYLFADDMKLYTGIFSKRDTARLQSDIYMVAEWTDKWLIKLN